MSKLTFSFDIGYASIGWAAVQGDTKQASEPSILGSGVVLFPSGDCLASSRRDFRRQRRNIRSRRVRIERMGRILVQQNCITAEEKATVGHPMPFYLAARALQGHQKLSALECWQVLRWYAHNRGYDGNASWANDIEESEDTEKVVAARECMKKHDCKSMAETICNVLELNPSDPKAQLSIDSPAYKTMNMAFPREIVVAEVKTILSNSAISATAIKLLLDPINEQRDELAACQVRLPKRHIGSILFGQLIPRFDNRIIRRCPITWAQEYGKAIAEGKSEKEAKQLAKKFAKVPNAHSLEFYEYRFARILANIKANGQPISAEQRQAFFARAKEEKRFTKTSFKKAAKEILGDTTTNLYNFFQIHPDSADALIMEPTDKKYRSSGRAPYARPVLRQVVVEILRGEDSTKPALSAAHPKGEAKASDGILYSLLDPTSEVNRIQQARSVTEMSNNHLVRHRMLIFERLLRDMCNRYADGDASRVDQFCIEVGRELREFSGKTPKEIASVLNERMKHFKSAVSYLQKNAPELPMSANIIRKCRIAMDMNWTCPFTLQKYSAYDLPSLEREHIVPYADRPTNALSALVLTWSEVNKMKGKRTALQFIMECQGQPIPGRNQEIALKKQYEKFVDKLDTKGAPDDLKRKKSRKQLLLIESVTRNDRDKEGKADLGFTEGQMTQSSQLMKIAAHVVRQNFSEASVLMLPGAVTSAARTSWRAWDILAEVCPDVRDAETGKILDKDSIRGITHLHHAIDAIVLGITPYLIPGIGNGNLWLALGKRHLSEPQVQELRMTHQRRFFKISERGQIFLSPLPATLRESIAAALREERVVQHVPADMSGAKLELNIWGIDKIEGTRAVLRQRSHTVNPDGRRRRVMKLDKMGKLTTESVNKLVGIHPIGDDSKLQKIKGALVISSNYGVALDPIPTMIPHFSVYKRLQELRLANGGKPVRVLRNGQIINMINMKKAEKNGLWIIKSVKNNKDGTALDLQRCSAAQPSSKTCSNNWINVKLSSILPYLHLRHDFNYTGL